MANIDESRSINVPGEAPKTDASFGEMVLGRSFGGLFENRESVVRTSAAEVRIDFAEATTSFSELAKSRANPASSPLSLEEVEASLCAPCGRPLNNVGVSVALTTVVEGERYAIVTRRKSDGALTLASGYVDAHHYEHNDHVSARGELLSAALKELTEEVLPARPRGGALELDAGLLIAKTARDVLREVALGDGGSMIEHADSTVCFLGSPFSAAGGDVPVTMNASSSWSVRPAPVPPYLLSLHPAPEVVVDGQPLQAGFVYDKCHDSGQVVFALEMELPAGTDASLLHSETALDADNPGWLKEVLDPRGIVLLRLNEAGFPDGRSYWMIDGKLVDRGVPAEDLKLSELFAPSREGKPAGIVDRTSVQFDEYAAAARLLS